MNNLIPLSVIQNTQFQSTIMKREAVNLDKFKNINSALYVQQKYNGCYTLIFVDDYGNCAAYNKNMAVVPNLVEALEEVKRNLRNGYVYIAEAVIIKDGKEDFEEASRSFNPNNNVKPNGEVKLFIFDLITLDDFIRGKSPVPFEERYQDLKELLYGCELSYIQLGTAYLISNHSQLTYFYNKGLTDGWEGVIITLTNSIWNRRISLCDTSWKLIPIPTIDLEIIGFKTGKGKHHGVASTLTYRARQWLKEDAPVIFLDIDGALDFQTRIDIAENFDKYKGKISKISYKGFTRYGKLRQPKVLEVTRHDKFISDIK